MNMYNQSNQAGAFPSAAQTQSSAHQTVMMPPLPQQAMSLLDCRGLSKSYEGGRYALSNVNLSLAPGKIVGLLGPNGSGKTTLIKLINGLLVPTSGEVFINGMPPNVETKSIVSYLPDSTYIAGWMKVEKILDFFADFYADFDRQRAIMLLQQLQVPADMTFKSLSKGTKEKVQLALVMSRRAQLYILDEPIGGVDPAARDYILRTIISNHAPNSTVIIATHLISDIEQVLDEVIFINQGMIVLHDSVDNIRMTRGQSVDEMFRQVFAC